MYIYIHIYVQLLSISCYQYRPISKNVVFRWGDLLKFSLKFNVPVHCYHFSRSSLSICKYSASIAYLFCKYLLTLFAKELCISANILISDFFYSLISVLVSAPKIAYRSGSIQKRYFI